MYIQGRTFVSQWLRPLISEAQIALLPTYDPQRWCSRPCHAPHNPHPISLKLLIQHPSSPPHHLLATFPTPPTSARSPLPLLLYPSQLVLIHIKLNSQSPSRLFIALYTTIDRSSLLPSKQKKCLNVNISALTVWRFSSKFAGGGPGRACGGAPGVFWKGLWDGVRDLRGGELRVDVVLYGVRDGEGR